MISYSKITNHSLAYYEGQVRETRTPDRERSAQAGAELHDYMNEAGEAPPEAFVVGAECEPGSWAWAGRPALAHTAEQGARGMAQGLGIEHGQQLDGAQVARWFGSGQAPGGEGETLGKQFGERSIHGYDFTANCPKSVSLLWALGTDDQRTVVQAAHDAAVLDALDHLAATTALTRARDDTGELHSVPLAGLSGAIYRHRTSREGDPHLHSHVLMHSRALRADGTWASLDWTAVLHQTRAAGCIYQARLRSQLGRELGVQWQTTDLHSGTAELAGVDRDTIMEWSRRRSTMDEWLAQHGIEPTSEAQNRAAHATRDRKDRALSTSELLAQWREDERDHPQQIGRDPGRSVDLPEDPEPSPESVLAHATDTQSTFRRHDLIESAATLWPSADTHTATLRARIERIADQAWEQAIHLSPPDPSDKPTRKETVEIATTAEVISQEADALTTATSRARLEREPGALPALVGNAQLGDDQCQAGRAILSSDRRATILEAPAGSGKTIMLAGLREAWEREDTTVHGYAPRGKAVQGMSEAIDSPETVATLMGRLRRQEPTGWHAGDLIVVDEAGATSSCELARIVDQAHRQDCRLLLVGDSHQLQAPQARSGLFALLSEHGGDTQTLGEVRRQHDPEERAATLELRDGAVDHAARWYAAHDRLHAGDQGSMAEAAYRGWRQDRAQGTDALLLTGTWADARALNLRAQADRIATGEIQAHELAAQLAERQEAHIGDQILARRNDYGLVDDAGRPVRNGQRWTVAQLDERQVTLAAGARSIDVPRGYLAEHALLGYALSIDGSQGVTADSAHVLASSDQVTRERAYVGMTRGRAANHVYLVDADLPTLPGAPAKLHDTTVARDLFAAAASTSRRELSAHAQLRDQILSHQREHPILDPPGAAGSNLEVTAGWQELVAESEQLAWERELRVRARQAAEHEHPANLGLEL